MPDRPSMLSPGTSVQASLKPYSADLPLGSLAVGVDNIRHDVWLSSTFVESTGAYLLEFIRQSTGLTFLSQGDRPQPERRPGVRGGDRKGGRTPEATAWKRQLSELLHTALQQAKYQQNIEIDLLMRVA